MFKLKKILCPTDFSETAFEAVQYALGLARLTKAKLVVMYVVDQRKLDEGLSLARPCAPEELGKEMADEARRRFKTLVPEEERRGVEWETKIRSGRPHQEVISFARENDVDLIVLGTVGHGVIEHMVFGSTADKVVRLAPCPVLTVKPPAARASSSR